MEDVKELTPTEDKQEGTGVPKSEPVCNEAPDPNWLNQREYDRVREEERDTFYREQNRIERLDFLAIEVLKLPSGTATAAAKLASAHIENRFK